jgi:5-methylcytosine-specific restriction endonuclease McrA
MKKCKKCLAYYPETQEYFSICYGSNPNKGYLRHVCRNCHRQQVNNCHTKNPESVKRASIRRYKNKYEHVIATVSNYRARKANVAFEYYTSSDVLARWGTCCHLCGEEIDLKAPRRPGLFGWEKSLHLDHVIPIIAGGLDILDNVKPAHAKCNLSRPKQLPKKDNDGKSNSHLHENW